MIISGTAVNIDTKVYRYLPVNTRSHYRTHPGNIDTDHDNIGNIGDPGIVYYHGNIGTWYRYHRYRYRYLSVPSTDITGTSTDTGTDTGIGNIGTMYRYYRYQYR